MTLKKIMDRANKGLISINEQLQVGTGYDHVEDALRTTPPEEWETFQPLSIEERLQLSNIMISRWMRYREALQGQEPPHERYCALCEKPGHFTDECQSTHGLNTPYSRELFRLASTPRVAPMSEDQIDQVAYSANERELSEMFDLLQELHAPGISATQQLSKLARFRKNARVGALRAAKAIQPSGKIEDLNNVSIPTVIMDQLRIALSTAEHALTPNTPDWSTIHAAHSVADLIWTCVVRSTKTGYIVGSSRPTFDRRHADDYAVHWNKDYAQVHATNTNAWITVWPGCLILSRTNWFYPNAVEGSAGARDEARYASIGKRDGDIVIHLDNMGHLDIADLRVMLSSLPAVTVDDNPPNTTINV